MLTLSIALSLAVLGACQSNQPDGASPSPTPPTEVNSEGEIATPTPLPEIPPPDAVPAGLEPVWEAYGLLVREYVDREKVDPDVLAEAAIRGMVSALGDRYTAYISRDTFQIENQNLQGDFQGIGAEVQMTRDGKRILIVAPLAGSPAEGAGIRPGDVIMAVNGEDTEGWSVVDAVNHIRGRRGTPVTLTVVHLGEIDPVEITIIRDTIKQDSVTYRMLEDAPYGLIRISTFTARTAQEVKDAVKALRDADARGLIIDLRSNPGGLLTATVDVASQFLRDGLVTYEIDGRGNRKDWKVKSGRNALETPMVVLVNAFSASGSEVLTGALQDHGRAVVIGTKTFGKGSVNILRSLSNGGGLYITFAHWYTPKGRLIEGEGLTPDVVVEYDPTTQAARHGQEDTQLAAAIAQLDFETNAGTAAVPPR